MVETAGRLDIVFNAMGPQPTEYGNGTSTMDLPVDRFMLPINTIVQSLFITARSSARHMGRERSGVLIFLSGTPSRGVAPNMSAIGAAFGAVQAMARSLAVELGPQGARVVCVRTMGMAETRTMQQTYKTAGRAIGVPQEKMAELVASRALLRRPPSLIDRRSSSRFSPPMKRVRLPVPSVNSSSGQVLD